MIVKQYNLNGLKLGKEIGKGQFGVVHFVISETNNKKYAAKLLNDEEDEKLAEEINNHSKCNHPAIVKFYGFNKTGFPSNRKPTIILEYVPNGSLQKLLENQKDKTGSISSKTLKYKDKLIIAYGIISAMSYLHENNIIHRDLKPDNILIDQNFYPKVSDLGLSKETLGRSLIISSVKGTPIYIAPEIVENCEYSKSIDVYAFGFILYQLFVDPRPFKGIKNQFKLFEMISQGKRPQFHDDTPEILKNLINRCWNQEAELRPTFDSLLIELKETPQYFKSLSKSEKKEFDRYVHYIDNFHTSFDKDRYVIDSSIDASVSSESLPLHEQYKMLADEGNTDAMYQYAFMVENGIGVPKNQKKANMYYKMAAKNEHVEAMKKYAFILENGICVDKDEKMACLYLKKAADAGDVDSMFSYGMKLKNGNNGVKTDIEKAFNYIKKAAKKDHKYALYNYALMLEKGETGVCMKDPELAAECFKKAADKGVVDAMFSYAKMKNKGDDGVPINKNEAAKYFKMAADKGNIKSMVVYGLYMERGITSPPDYDEACIYFKKAADAEDPRGLYHYGRMFDEGKGIDEEKSKAFFYFKSSADKNYTPAIITTASKLENGEGTNKDLQEAFKYYKMAAKNGDQNSKTKCTELKPFIKMINEEDAQKIYKYAYELYTKGKIEYALFYYKKAASKNHIDAMNNLAELLLKTDDPNDENDALGYLKYAADNGQKDAMFNYANLMAKKDNNEEAIKYYKMILDFHGVYPIAITDSQLSAMNNYALILLNDKNSKQNVIEGEKYLKIAANYGNVLSMYNLGNLYYSGEVVQKNFKLAAKYFQKAADLGHKQAMRNYAIMLFNGEGVPKDQNKANKYFIMEALNS